MRSQSFTLAVLAALLAPFMSFAVGPDFTSITSAVDWSTVGAAIIAIAALKASPLVVSVGTKMVLRMIGR